MLHPAQRVEHLYESTIRSLTVYAASKGAINLGQGSPDFNPPQELLDAASRALTEGWNQYVPTWGLPELREAIANKTERFYGFRPDPNTEVTVTCGVTEAVISALVGLVDKGDKVIILEPAHENYHAGVVFAGAEAIWVPLRPLEVVNPPPLRTQDSQDLPPRPEFKFDSDELKKAFAQPNVKAVIFNTPHNPSGRVFSYEELKQIADLCIQYNVLAISDEIYEHMVFDGLKHIPIATLPGMMERTITISGLSKSYSVTGWRVGYCIAPEKLTNALRKIHDFTTICAPAPLQKAGVTAMNFGQDYYDWLTKYYLERRSRAIGIFKDAGFIAPTPEGAYYTLADFRPVADALGLSHDDEAFVYWMIENIGIGSIPGSSFYRSDPSLGQGRVRFAFPKKDETLDKVAEKFLNLKKLMGEG